MMQRRWVRTAGVPAFELDGFRVVRDTDGNPVTKELRLELTAEELEQHSRLIAEMQALRREFDKAQKGEAE